MYRRLLKLVPGLEERLLSDEADADTLLDIATLVRRLYDPCHSRLDKAWLASKRGIKRPV